MHTSLQVWKHQLSLLQLAHVNRENRSQCFAYEGHADNFDGLAKLRAVLVAKIQQKEAQVRRGIFQKQ